MLQPLRVRPGVALLALGLLMGRVGRVDAATPLDPAESYRVRGEAAVTIEGAQCCGGAPLMGTFEASYDVESGGAATLRRLVIGLEDTNVVVHGGFLGLFSERIFVRCGSVGLDGVALGTRAAPDRIDFAPGSVSLHAAAAESREPTGDCAEVTLSGQGVNTSILRVTHKPNDDTIGLEATTVVDAEGVPYTVHISATGRYTNRPPRAALAFRSPDGTVPQGGCPAFSYWNGQQFEPVAEANGPSGLVASLLSYSADPDGTWGAADVLNDLWFDTRGGGTRTRIASGRTVGPFTFDWGLPHSVELLALDHVGAADAVECRFRVIDTRPPVVHAPPPLVIGCSTLGGATRATSAPLAAFLAGATAVDVVDTTPTALAPQIGGVDVTATTLFPANASRTVRFRFVDDSNRLGVADGSVRVQDVVPPAVTVAVTPPVLPKSNSFFTVNATPTATDACGGPLTYRLVSITSNAPSFDASDILSAAFGTDDRSFLLRGRPAGPTVNRFYKVVYEARDAAGNFSTASAIVTVPAN
jgi:hypothetical protein